MVDYVAKKIKPYNRTELLSLHETLMHSVEANTTAFSKVSIVVNAHASKLRSLMCSFMKTQISVSQIEAAKNEGKLLSSLNVKNVHLQDEEVEELSFIKLVLLNLIICHDRRLD